MLFIIIELLNGTFLSFCTSIESGNKVIRVPADLKGLESWVKYSKPNNDDSLLSTGTQMCKFYRYRYSQYMLFSFMSLDLLLTQFDKTFNLMKKPAGDIAYLSTFAACLDNWLCSTLKARQKCYSN